MFHPTSQDNKDTMSTPLTPSGEKDSDFRERNGTETRTEDGGWGRGWGYDKSKTEKVGEETDRGRRSTEKGGGSTLCVVGRQDGEP